MIDVPPPGFHEEWFHEVSQKALAGLVKEVKDVEGMVVEIGAWEGRSTVAMANSAHPRSIHTVDTWNGSPGEISGPLAASRDVFGQWMANIGHYTRGNVIPHRMGWREFASDFPGPVALVFIDAEHTYREVTDNIEAFRDRMSPGGIMCGDDAHHPPVRRAVLDAFPGEEVTHEASLWVRR